MKLQVFFEETDNYFAKINLFEIMNTKVDLKWEISHENQTIFATFHVGEKQFKVFFESGFFKVDYVNIGFFQIIDGKETTELTNNVSSSASIIISGVFQAIQEFLKKYEVNALVFAALNNVDKRMKLYNRIISLYSSRFGIMISDIKTSTGAEVTVLISHKVPKDQIDEFKEYVKDQMKFK